MKDSYLEIINKITGEIITLPTTHLTNNQFFELEQKTCKKYPSQKFWVASIGR